MQVLENLWIKAAEGSEGVYVCGRCDEEIGTASVDFRELCQVRQLSLSDLGPLFADPQRYVDDAFVYSEYVCRHCGGLFDSAVERVGDAPVRRFEIKTSD